MPAPFMDQTNLQDAAHLVLPEGVTPVILGPASAVTGIISQTDPVPHIHFSHANGYPPRAYLPLLEALAQKARVVATPLRPLWPGQDPALLNHWGELSQDLEAILDAYPRPPGSWIGMGHSVGATVTLKLAVRRPGLFSQLVLVDPPFFPPAFAWFWKVVVMLGLGYKIHPLAPGALRRRRVFPSSSEMYSSYRNKRVFQHLSDSALQHLVQALAGPLPDGRVELAYPPEWEARIYVTSALDDPNTWRQLARAPLPPGLPVLFIRGIPEGKLFGSPTFATATFKRFKRLVPQAELIDIPGATHLVPLEQPGEVARLALSSQC